MKAMVLAAGVGSRLDPLTSLLPKPLVPVANRPVMQHILDLLKKYGITSVISNLHYQPGKIQDYFGDGKSMGMNLEYKLESELTGDAGGMRACRKFLQGGTFIVLMGDLITDADLSFLIAEHKNKKALATIALKQVEDVSHFGVALTDSNGFITGFQEKPSRDQALSNYASCGIYVLEPEIFEYVPHLGSYGFGRQLFPKLVDEGQTVLGVSIDDYYWSDVGTINQYWQSNLDALSRRVRLNLEGDPVEFGFLGAGSKLGDKLVVNGILMLGKNSTVASSVTVTGTVIVGDDCVIGEGAELEDTVVWSGSKIDSKAKFKRCVVGGNCVVDVGSASQKLASISHGLASN